MIVGIGYKARAGKDTAAGALTRDLGFVRRGFADKLKELAYVADPLVAQGHSAMNIQTGAGHLAHIVNGLTWEGAKDSHPEVRRFLENLGDGARRVLGQNVWLDAVLNEFQPGDDVVIPDVRYMNEASAIQAAGGIVVNIVRAGSGSGTGHSSDVELDGWSRWDHVIQNDGSVVDLERKIVAIVKGTEQWQQRHSGQAPSSPSPSPSDQTAPASTDQHGVVPATRS